MLVASACYAISAVVIRRYLRGVEPLTIAGVSLIVGAIAVIAVTLVAARPLPAWDALSATTLAAALTLALLNTVFAYFLFYHLIDIWGATRTTLVTYVMPPVGVTLGWRLLDEPIDWKIVVGAALILGGIVAVNWRRTPVRAAPVRGAATPGSVRPPRNSSDAPPPVEMWLIFAATPALVTAEIESPPPMIVVPSTSATARATALVPAANASISNTPIGPFQTTVFAPRSTAA